MIITLQTLIFFRESLLSALDRLLRPYYNKLSLAFGRNGEASDDEESDEQVFAEYDEERGVVFYPPMYLQRYAAVSDCLIDEQWCGRLEKVVDLGYHDMSFINYLKEVEGVKCILGVDLESIPLSCSIDLIGCEDYVSKRNNPLEVTLFKGNAADPDYRLIGCDAVIAIEMIEHMLPHDLDRLIHTVFGFIKPWIAIFTTPNGDFNVLFKNLEKNGLRRLDHFFEWSREQFHDWCSNIVVRYPQYTVSCKGIGPGPNGTKHLGCCSQMALFVSKQYSKQQDLNLNSLALVSDSPRPNSISNLISSWAAPDIPCDSIMIEPPKNIESYSELQSRMQSSITLVLSSPSNSLETIIHQDKASQCNLDNETERSYLMFDYEQMCFDVLKPRRNINNHRVYDIGDVNNRLNCTTLEVKKFSKTTLNLMAKNKLDTLVHTREVVDEIRYLTKMLNFNKDLYNQLESGTHTWCNINWGENAPYWNQYYKIVKAYNYPFEVKSDECRILDLISDEINRLVDAQFDEDYSFEVNKLEIPVPLLMRVVEHITDDVEKVKDLLEWNGFEVVDNFVIHSRMVLDYSSPATQEDDSPETTDVYSDWDSTSVSDGSTTVPDCHARCLRRALDQKVRRLRSMLTADEDIATELDQVVCRLMNLAIRTSKGRNTPPPTRWMHCKLLDLLTLTEKTIERRKRHFVESYPLKANNYDEKSQDMVALKKIKEDDTALRIVDKYKHLVNQTDDNVDLEYRYLDFELEDDLTVTSIESAKDHEYIDKYPILPDLESETTILGSEIFHADDVAPQGETKFRRTQAWVDEDIEVVPYRMHDGNFDNSSVDTDHNAANFTRYYKKRFKGKQCVELNCVIRKKSHSKAYKQNKIENKMSRKTKLAKKMSQKKSFNKKVSGVQTTFNKFVSVESRTYRIKPRRKPHKNLYPTASQPIPISLIELCHPEMMIEQDIGPFNRLTGSMTKFSQNKKSYEMKTDVAATKESNLIEIITEDTQEIIALQRTIGTEADADSMIFEDEMLLRSVSNTLINEDDMLEKHNISTENVHSQTIFLYDLDEPTTSKGIRHIGMDVQCGPDASAPVYSMLSATTSLTKVSKMFTAGIKIGDSATDTKITSTDFGTCTNDVDNSYRTIIPRNRSVGIKIKDSDSNIIVNQTEPSTVSTYSTLSATTSLTTMPQVSTAGIKVGDSKTDDRIKNTDFEICTDTSERINSFLPMETIVGFKIKDSMSIIPKQLEFSTNTNDPFDHKIYFSKVTTILESLSHNNLNKGLDKNVSLNMESSTNTQELYDKVIVSSQQIFKDETEEPKEPCVQLEFKDFSSNLPNRIKYPTKSQESYDKSDSLLKQTFQKQKSPKAIQKKSVDFKLQDSVSHIPKRVNCSTTAQKKLCDKPMFSSLNTTSEVIPENISVPKRSEVICDSDPELLNELKSLTDTEYFNTSSLTSSPPSFAKQTVLRISKLTETGIGIEDKNSNPLEKNNSQVKILDVNYKSSVSAQFSKETTLLLSHRELKTDDSISDIYVNVDGVYKIPTCSTLDNGDLQVVSADNKKLNNLVQPATKNAKQKLCTGGVQVHSYRDKQTLSEDIMYQGQWQQNMPKVLARKKCCLPVALKKKELKKSNRPSSNERNRKNNKVKNDLKPEIKQPLLLRHTIKTTLKQESKTKENKQVQKPPITACAATTAKPFRNILKVPSKFPISNLPSKNPKSLIVTKTPITPTRPVKKDEKPLPKGRKTYIPLYLRQRGLDSANKTSKTDLNSSLDTVTSKIKKSKDYIPQPLLRSTTEEIKRDLLKFQTKPQEPECVVFRNEIEKKKSDGQQIKNTSESVRKKDVSRQRSSTPTSANSSTCSSPCSIATVRAASTRTKNVTSRRHSSSSYVNNTATFGSENSTPERNRKFTKRYKSGKVAVENKENIPQRSNHFNVGKKDSSKLVKSMFMAQNKNVYISQVKESIQSTTNTPSKHKNQKSNVTILDTKSFTDKKSSPRPSPSVSNKASLMIDASLSTTHINEISDCAQTSDMVLIIEPQARQLHIPTDLPTTDDANVVCLVTKNAEDTDKGMVDIHSNEDIKSCMKEFLERTLDFIHEPLDEYKNDSDVVIFNREGLAPQADSPASPTSFKTAITNYDNNEVLPSDIEYTLNRSFDSNLTNDSIMSLNDTHFTVTNFDVLSFKSMTSGSKLSGYLSADTEFSSSIKIPKCSIPAPVSKSMREIFERKEQPLQPAENQNTTGALANQAFSGFTINEDPVAGDKPDLVNIIDSETGSLLAVAIPRQAASEELLISGRSSESFESCVLDDDTVVPNWLFQLISHQASSLDELEPPAEQMAPLAVVEPLFDDNANVIEGAGVGAGAGAGAGDGRGIHSDHSQDSSGRGTSVSSSETSSGAQSEVILIDPVAFAAQFELLRDAVESSVVLAINNPDASDNATGSRQVPAVQEPEQQSFSGGKSRRSPRAAAAGVASDADADADISSLDTDEVPDFSDN